MEDPVMGRRRTVLGFPARPSGLKREVVAPEGEEWFIPEDRYKLFGISKNQNKALRAVLEFNPLKAHGIAHDHPRLYRSLKDLRERKLVARKGYRYYPTRGALMWLVKQKKGPQQVRLHQALRPKRKKVAWKKVFRRLG